MFTAVPSRALSPGESMQSSVFTTTIPMLVGGAGEEGRRGGEGEGVSHALSRAASRREHAVVSELTNTP